MYLRPHEWKHDQRWEAQEIVPNLFCGPLRAAKDFDFIQKAGITHVIAIKYPVEERIPNPQYPNNSIHFYQINIQDGIMDNAIPFFTLFNRYVNDAINAGGRVLVYCISGLNQGAAFVISYLIKHHGMNFEDAHQLMRMRRFCTIISEAFKYQLMEYEHIFPLLDQQLQGGNYSMPNGLKREHNTDISSQSKRGRDDFDQPGL